MYIVNTDLASVYTQQLLCIYLLLTGVYDVLEGGEPLADPRADGAQDEDRRQVRISHQRAPQQASPLVSAVHIPRHHHHQVVRQREAGVLTPPSVEGQGHVKSCGGCNRF